VSMGIRKFGHRRLLLVAAQELRATINGLRGSGNGGDLEKQQLASKRILPAPNAEPTASGCWPRALGAAQPFEDGQNPDMSPRASHVFSPGMPGPLAALHQTVAQPPLQHFVHASPQVAFFPQPLPRATVPLIGVPAQAGLSARVAAGNMVGPLVGLPHGSAHLRLMSPRTGGPWSSRSTMAMEPTCNIPPCGGPASARMSADPLHQYGSAVQAKPQRGATSPPPRPPPTQHVCRQQSTWSPHCHL